MGVWGGSLQKSGAHTGAGEKKACRQNVVAERGSQGGAKKSLFMLDHNVVALGVLVNMWL